MWSCTTANFLNDLGGNIDQIVPDLDFIEDLRTSIRFGSKFKPSCWPRSRFATARSSVSTRR